MVIDHLEKQKKYLVWWCTKNQFIYLCYYTSLLHFSNLQLYFSKRSFASQKSESVTCLLQIFQKLFTKNNIHKIAAILNLIAHYHFIRIKHWDIEGQCQGVNSVIFSLFKKEVASSPSQKNVISIKLVYAPIIIQYYNFK